jgi:hypothetical protein
METQQTYREPALVELGDVVTETLGNVDSGGEVNTMKLPHEDM